MEKNLIKILSLLEELERVQEQVVEDPVLSLDFSPAPQEEKKEEKKEENGEEEKPLPKKSFKTMLPHFDSVVTWMIGSIALILGLIDPGLTILVLIFLVLPRMIMHSNGTLGPKRRS